LNLKRGDRIVTSGLGGVFPPNLPIGKIREIVIPESEPTRVVVEPAVDFDTLRTVMIIIDHVESTEDWITPPQFLPEALEPGVATQTATTGASTR
jgi:rod shape-determining protein MreC